jgi:hypothetical protein
VLLGRAIRLHDAAAAGPAHAALDNLLAHNILQAPAGARRTGSRRRCRPRPFVAFAHDGGLDRIRASYRQAARGDARNLAESCRANAPG